MYILINFYYNIIGFQTNFWVTLNKIFNREYLTILLNMLYYKVLKVQVYLYNRLNLE